MCQCSSAPCRLVFLSVSSLVTFWHGRTSNRMFSLVIDLLMPQLAWCGGLGGARKDADLFQQLFVIAEGDLRESEIGAAPLAASCCWLAVS